MWHGLDLTDKQEEALQVVLEERGILAAAEKLGISDSAVRRRLEGIARKMSAEITPHDLLLEMTVRKKVFELTNISIENVQ